jgi:hypothetical protein
VWIFFFFVVVVCFLFVFSFFFILFFILFLFVCLFVFCFTSYEEKKVNSEIIFDRVGPPSPRKKSPGSTPVLVYDQCPSDHERHFFIALLSRKDGEPVFVQACHPVFTVPSVQKSSVLLHTN